MHNKKLIQDIVAQAQIEPHETVVELGAGKGGSSTYALAERAHKMIAVEYDERLVEELRQKAQSYPNLVIIQGDILKIRLPREKFVVVSQYPLCHYHSNFKNAPEQPLKWLPKGTVGGGKRGSQTLHLQICKR